MRRKDREITDMKTIVSIMQQCDVCRLAFFDEEYPYIVPMNFGLQYKDDELVLYFHGAKVGKKLTLLEANNKVSFEMDCRHELVEGDRACDYSMNYASVIGCGTMEILNDAEKIAALDALMRQYVKDTAFTYGEKELNAVAVMKLTVKQVTSKQRA